jgi:hypothetical protein
MRALVHFVVVIVVAWVMAPGIVLAGVGSKLVQETAEFLIRRGGREVAGETVETLAKKMTAVAGRHSDDVVAAAFKRVGPRAARIASEAGDESAGTVLRLLSRHGDDAIRVASRPKALKLIAKFGDDVAEPLIRHGEVGERLIEKFGGDGAEALGRLSEQNIRRLAILLQEQGDKVTPGLVQLFAKNGHADTLAEYVWRNKGALFVGGTLAAFIAQPEPFLNVAENITTKTLESTVQPIVTEAASQFSWGPMMVIGLLLGGAIVIERIGAAKVIKSGLSIVAARTKEVTSKPVLRFIARPKENGNEHQTDRN